MFSVRRPDTLEFALPNCLRKLDSPVTRDDVLSSILESIGRPAVKSIKCVQRSSSGFGFRITFKNGTNKERESLLTKGIYLRGCFCYLSGVEISYQVVIVSNLPCELDDSDVSLVLREYGEVKDVIRHTDKLGIETGDRRVLMVLKKHIPSKLSFEPFLAYVRYRGQPCCCNHCNWWGHTTRNCPLDKHCGICGSVDHTTHACSLPLVIPPDYPIEWPRTARFMSHPGCLSEHTERLLRQVNPFSHVIPPPPSTPPPCPPSTSRPLSTQPSMMHSLFGSTSDITDMSQSASRPLSSESLMLRSLFGSISDISDMSQDSPPNILNIDASDASHFPLLSVTVPATPDSPLSTHSSAAIEVVPESQPLTSQPVPSSQLPSPSLSDPGCLSSSQSQPLFTDSSLSYLHHMSSSRPLLSSSGFLLPSQPEKAPSQAAPSSCESNSRPSSQPEKASPQAALTSRESISLGTTLSSPSLRHMRCLPLPVAPALFRDPCKRLNSSKKGFAKPKPKPKPKPKTGKPY